jgi:hypothetical protein
MAIHGQKKGLVIAVSGKDGVGKNNYNRFNG